SGEVGGASPACALSQPRTGQADNLNSLPQLAPGESHLGMIVSAGTAEHGHLVTGLRQNLRQIAKVLGGGDDVGIERLVEKKNPHKRSGVREAAQLSRQSPAQQRTRPGRVPLNLWQLHMVRAQA